MSFFVVACFGALGYQSPESRLRLSCRGLFVLLMVGLRTLIGDDEFRHLIESSAFDYAPDYVPFPGVAKVDRTPCKSDEH